MRQRNTEQTFVNLYLFFAKKGLLPLPDELARRKKRRRGFRDGELLTTSQTARFLKVSVKTLANWRVKGDGPVFTKIGSCVVYDFSELKSFVATRSRPSTSAGRA
ncbi:helix-turn-helix domain-containing protein [Mesorhizobium sp. M0187]|uniref:helix-turn-helix transcriptional regulator n=1 Tax=Mesorhizobium sp. M0187 TaxID=2956908 RepID=UPI00333A5D66